MDSILNLKVFKTNDLIKLRNKISAEITHRQTEATKKENALKTIELEETQTCWKCEETFPLSKMCKVQSAGIKGAKYECFDNSQCRLKVVVSQQQEIEKHKHKNFDTFIKNLNLDYEVSRSDLIESSVRFRDGSIHYFHNSTGDCFSFNFMRKFWYVTPDNIKNNIKNN